MKNINKIEIVQTRRKFENSYIKLFQNIKQESGVLKLIKGVIFDFDGLIVDTETTWYEAFKEVFYESHHINIDLR